MKFWKLVLALVISAILIVVIALIAIAALFASVVNDQSEVSTDELSTMSCNELKQEIRSQNELRIASALSGDRTESEEYAKNVVKLGDEIEDRC